MEASTSDYRPKRGRPKLEVPVQRIGLRMDVYDEWLAKKDSVGFYEKTHSEFAEYLLKISDEPRGQNTPTSCGEFYTSEDSVFVVPYH